MVVRTYPTRYKFGENIVLHKGVRTTTSVGSIQYDNFVADIENVFQYDIGFIPFQFAHRPDLISNLFYGTPEYWWLLMLVNGVTDPFEQFKPGDRIKIPRI